MMQTQTSRSFVTTWISAICTAALLVLTACGGGGEAEDDQQQAQEPELPDDELAVHEPWVRPASAGGNSALYLTLLNGTSSADTLVDVDAPIIGGMSVHESVDSAGTSMMKPADSVVAVAPKSRVKLEPGGKHIMLTNLQQSLQEGQSVILSLDFAQAGLRRVQAPIRTQAPNGSEE